MYSRVLENAELFEADLVRAAMVASRDCIKILDLDGRIEFISEAGRIALELDDASSVLGRTWFEFWSGRDRDRAFDAFMSAGQGRTVRVHLFLSTIRSTPKWWDIAISPITNVSGNVRRLLIVSRDITEQRTTEQRLRETAERYRLAARATSDAIWDVDLVNKTIKWNEGRHFGYEQMGEDIEWWLDRVADEDRSATLANMEAVYAGRLREWSTEYRFRRADGSFATVLDRAYVLYDSSLNPVRIVGAMMDLSHLRAAEARSAELAARLTGLLDHTSDAVVFLGRDWRIQFMNRSARVLIGPDRNICGQVLWDCMPGLRNTEFGRAYEKAMETSTEAKASGFYAPLKMWVEATAYPFSGGLTVFFRDVTSHYALVQALKDSEERLKIALRAGRVVAWEQDAESGFLTFSENSWDVLGVTSCEANDFRKRVHPEDLLLAQKIAVDGKSTEFRFQKSDGEEIWIAALSAEVTKSGGIRRYGTMADITERVVAQQKLWAAAHQDPLTSLPNRRCFQKRLEHFLQFNRGVILLLIDLDQFKEVNDLEGHDAGDALLTEMAIRLKGALPDAGLIARIGGDEFAALLEADTYERLEGRIEALLDELRRPFVVRSSIFSCRSSIGVTSAPQDGSSPASLLKCADIALYAAKRQGRNRAAFYDSGMEAAVIRRAGTLKEVRKAIDLSRIVPFYQPKICLPTNRVIGFEALARWIHPERGVLGPAAFGDAFEDPDLAVGITQQILRGVARDIRHWTTLGVPYGRVALNASPPDFAKPDFPNLVFAELRKFGVPPHALQLEVTETVFLGHAPKEIGRMLRKFRRRGIRISLDDFGTGFASLTHLKQFPVDEVKIDKSFVGGLTLRKDDTAIVDAVIGLSRNLSLDVVAEGVETQAQVEYLRRAGCHVGQGFFFSRPLSAEQVPAFMRSWTGETIRLAG